MIRGEDGVTAVEFLASAALFLVAIYAAYTLFLVSENTLQANDQTLDAQAEARVALHAIAGSVRESSTASFVALPEEGQGATDSVSFPISASSGQPTVAYSLAGGSVRQTKAGATSTLAHGISSLAFSRDGKHVVVLVTAGSGDKAVTLRTRVTPRNSW